MSAYRVDPDALGVAAVRLTAVSSRVEDVAARLDRAAVLDPLGESGWGPNWRCVALEVASYATELRRLAADARVAGQLYAARDATVSGVVHGLDGALAHTPGLANLVGMFAGGPRHWVLLVEARAFGLFIEPDPDSAGVIAVPPGVGPGASPGVSGPPRTMADLVALQAWLDGQGSRIRVLQVPQADGASAWVVTIPGTQSWAPVSGPNPFDATTDLRAMNQERTAAGVAVLLALESAQRSAGRFGRGDPVLFSGHSQGGILATQLACDSQVRARFAVRAVLATGAPIDRFTVPPEVRVLSIEHAADLVPRLDGFGGSTGPTRSGALRVVLPQPGTGALASHDGSLYVRTARVVDEVPARAIDGIGRWRQASAPFLAGGTDVVARDYLARRQWQNPGP